MGYIDLHVHSRCSDGSKSVEDVVNEAVANGVTTISFTEHYNLGAQHLALKCAPESLEVLPGIEIGTSLVNYGLSKRSKCHLLIYYPPSSICELLDSYETSREMCVERTLKLLRKHFKITYNDVYRYSRSPLSIGRFDIAIAIYKMGYSTSPYDAYGDYLDIGAPCYVQREKMTPEVVLKKIHEMGGVACLAHPKSLKMSFVNLYVFLKELKSYGLCGVEVYNSCHTQEQKEIILEIADSLQLIPTVGSDYHGDGRNSIYVGTGINNNLCIDDYSIVERITNTAYHMRV